MPNYSDTILATPGLVGYWRLGEASGGTADDAFGSTDGTNTAITYATDGAITGDADTAYTFNGSTSKVTMANPAALQLTSGSVECWMKATDAGASYRAIVSKRKAYCIYLKSNKLGWISFSGTFDSFSVVDPTDDVWHHLVLTFQSGVTNGTLLYLDGSLILTGTNTVVDQLTGLSIGTEGGAGSAYYAGSIDEVAIYSSILTPTQIAAHYNAGRGIFPVSPVPNKFNVRTNALLRQ